MHNSVLKKIFLLRSVISVSMLICICGHWFNDCDHIALVTVINGPYCTYTYDNAVSEVWGVLQDDLSEKPV